MEITSLSTIPESQLQCPGMDHMCLTRFYKQSISLKDKEHKANNKYDKFKDIKKKTNY